MQTQFEKEWEEKIGPTSPSFTDQSLADTVAKQNSKSQASKSFVVKKIQELEKTVWYLQNAHESVNVYSNMPAFEEKGGQALLEVDQLDKYKLYEGMKSLQI